LSANARRLRRHRSIQCLALFGELGDPGFEDDCRQLPRLELLRTSDLRALMSPSAADSAGAVGGSMKCRGAKEIDLQCFDYDSLDACDAEARAV